MHYQNHADILPYQMRVDSGKLPYFRAYDTTHEERFIREFMLQLKLGRVQAELLHRALRRRSARAIRAATQVAVQRGLWQPCEAMTLCLNREGLMQVDRLLHEFFLPQHRHARYT